MSSHRATLLAALCAWSAATALPSRAAETALNPPPTPKAWADLGRLPDWSGVWTPNITAQNTENAANPPPWTPQAARQIAHLEAEERAGRPRGLFVNCLPEGMPSWMLISHNAFEALLTPGRVTLLGESDGNRLRRIYTDGRGHPDDPDPTFHGHSIGRWEGDALVVDTVGVAPQAYLATGEAVGIPNNGDLHVTERIRLAAPDELHDELTITAPHVLTRPWTTTRIYYRQRARKYDIVEGECLQGAFSEAVDAEGNAVFTALPLADDGRAAPPVPSPPRPGGRP